MITYTIKNDVPDFYFFRYRITFFIIVCDAALFMNGEITQTYGYEDFLKQKLLIKIWENRAC